MEIREWKESQILEGCLGGQLQFGHPVLGVVCDCQ
jgi:hypothetical protein